AIVDAATSLDLVAEDDLLPRIVEGRDEPELAVAIDGPARERASDFDDVLLRVTAVNAQRVQLQQLAPVVLVETALLLLAVIRIRPRLARRRRRREAAEESTPSEPLLISNLRGLGLHLGLPIRSVWIRTEPVIEIEEHRRTLRVGFQQVAEVIEDMRTD